MPEKGYRRPGRGKLQYTCAECSSKSMRITLIPYRVLSWCEPLGFTHTKKKQYICHFGCIGFFPLPFADFYA